MMRVMYDSQIFTTQRVGGISRYFASMALAMSRLEGVEPSIVAPVHFNEYLSHLPRRLVFGRYLPAMERLRPVAGLLGILVSGISLRTRRPDIVHRTYYYPQLRPSARSRTATVLTIYDMIHEKLGDRVSASAPIIGWKKAAVLAADHVICISENTRRDLLGIYGLSPQRVSVTYLGFDSLSDLLPEVPPDSYRLRVFGHDQPYVLYVGSRFGYKNFDSLLEAYASSPDLRDAFSLLCFGGGPFTPAELARIEGLGVAGRVRQHDGSDADLALAYRNAAVFVYPSRYEGFGIPPLEAMSLDTPVACSRTSSLPEVVGDAAELFDPGSVDEMRYAIERIAREPALRETLIARGRIQRAKFSWRQCAEETLNCYRKVVG